MCYAWFLSGYNYFNVVIDEKSAFNNARDCFQLFFQRSVNIMETGIKDKAPFSVKIRSRLFRGRGVVIFRRHPVGAVLFRRMTVHAGTPLPVWGNLLPKILTSLLGSTIMKVFPLLLISSFFEHGSATSFIRLQSGLPASAPSNVQSGRLPKGWSAGCPVVCKSWRFPERRITSR